MPGLELNGHETGDGELILKHAGKPGWKASSPRRSARLFGTRSVAFQLIGDAQSSSATRCAIARLAVRCRRFYAEQVDQPSDPVFVLGLDQEMGR